MFATVSCLKVNTNTTTKHEKGQKKNGTYRKSSGKNDNSVIYKP